MKIDDRINLLREKMLANDLDAYIIPTNDPHQSEYVSDHWKSREWISGFTGSAGVIVITQGHAGLWTDSRYFIQAEEELQGSSVVLHKIKVQHTPQHVEWIVKNLQRKAKVGIDGWLMSKGQNDQYKKILSTKDITMILDIDIISQVWKNRPPLPKDEIFLHDPKYSGKTCNQKIEEVRNVMKSKHVDIYLITALDEIAWVLNIRGKDVDYNPVCIAYALIGMDFTTIYIDGDKVTEEVREYFKSNEIMIKDYYDLVADLNILNEKETILVSPHQVSNMLYKAINGEAIHGESIIKLQKAIKNDTEIMHIRSVMKKDGAALANAFYWLEQTLKERSVSEVEFSDKLAMCRNQQGGYFGESFGAIVGFKGNGAIVHYRPQPGKCAKIKKGGGILLVDSGGQYVDGTTDITRTIALGEPTEEQKKNFTLVLKGHIALAQARFPAGTTGQQLGTFARQFLWDAGKDYGHGTGHGVGFFLNVHEGPQGFAPIYSERGKTAHKPGMFTSNEPGYYKEGEYGIRTENLVITKEDDTKGFLSFETVTLYPIDIRLIDETNMSSAEKAWFNRYHARVYKEVSPFLSEEIRAWFKLKCRPLN